MNRAARAFRFLLFISMFTSLFPHALSPAQVSANAASAPITSAMTQSTAFPSTAILDAFNRANGSLGVAWVGSTSGYQITTNAVGGSGNATYWSTPFGAAQEAFATLTAIDAAADEIDLLLKHQSGGSNNCDVLEVFYQPSTGRAQVWTCHNSGTWTQHGGDIALTLQSGDRFGARAQTDGTVTIYKNTTLVGTITVSNTWPYRASGGQIGFWLLNGGTTRLDDVGGGTVNDGSTTPTSTATTVSATNTPTATPATNTPTVAPATNTPTRTPTAAPATNTPTRTPTAAPATNTPTIAPATNTPTRTPTVAPATNTPTATATALPTVIATNTATATPLPTNTSLPSLTSIPPTNTAPPAATATPSSSAFPSTSVLDAFTRADGALGSSWTGQMGGYAIAGNRVDVGSGGALYWTNSAGADQEVFVTISTLDTNGDEFNLLLKGQGTNACDMLEVTYLPRTHLVQVVTCTGGTWTQHGSDLALTLQSGDRFGARARANGTVEIYQNGMLRGQVTVAAAWAYRANGGRIGLWILNAANTVLDDFGGGSLGVAPTPTPTPTAATTATSTPMPPTPTRTSSPTATVIPTVAATSLPSNTPTRTAVTATAPATATSTPVSPTATRTPTQTATSIPTAAATSTPTTVPTGTPTACADAYEPDNSLNTARPFTVGLTQTHGLCVGDDYDWVSFQGVANTVYDIRSAHDSTSYNDADLTVYRPDGVTQSAFAYDYNDPGAKLTIAITETNTYYVRIGRANQSDVTPVSYTLHITPSTCSDNYEQDDTVAQARPFVLGETQHRGFCSSRDVDWVAFPAIAGRKLEFRMAGVAGSIPQISLYDTNGTTRLVANNTSLDYTFATAGTYYVRIFDGASSNTVYQYDLYIGVYPCNDLTEPNDSAAQAMPLTVGTPQQQVACTTGGVVDTDWFTFTIATTDFYQITLATQGTAQEALTVYQSDGTTNIASAGRFQSTAMLTTTLQIGTYYVIASHVNGGSARSIYTIQVQKWSVPLRNVSHLTPTPTWPAGTPTPTVTPTAAPAILATEAAIREQINSERTSRGFAPLAHNTQLDEAARTQARDLTCCVAFGHVGPDGSQPIDRARRAGYDGPYAGENASGGNSNPVDAWMQSLGHRKGILFTFTREIGAGAAQGGGYGVYHTAVFGSGSSANFYPIFINNGALTTSSPQTILTIPRVDEQTATWQFQVSNSVGFANATWQDLPVLTTVYNDAKLGPITHTVPLSMSWSLTPGVGERSVFVRYRRNNGTIVVSRATIWLTAPANVDTTTLPPLPPAMQQFQSPDLVDAATYDQPIAVPVGLLPPALTLHSNSYVVDEGRTRPGGALGAGTSLGEYAVLRRPDATPNDTSDDAYVLLWDGMLYPLVYADPSSGGDGFYHRERERAGETFLISRKIGAAHSSDGGAYWEITDTQRMVWRLGYTTDSTWRYVDGTNATHPWRWNLDRVQDLNTNYQIWDYTTELGIQNGVTFERGGSISTIAWNGNMTENRIPDRRLVFSYVSRVANGTPDYIAATDRFYVTKRLDRIEAQVNGQRVWDYALRYDTPDDGGRTRVLLRGITQHGTDATTTLSDVELTYTPPVSAGEGYHLNVVKINGTSRIAYTYDQLVFNGVRRYRVKTIKQGQTALTAGARVRLVSLTNQGGGASTVNCPNGFGSPDGGTFWGYAECNIDNGNGDSFTRRYRTEPPFQGLEYKEFCKTLDGLSGTALDRPAGNAAPMDQGSSAVCHEDVANYDAANTYSGVTRIQVPSTFEDIRQPGGSVQHLQTNYTYTAGGQVLYEDQFGEQGTPTDDRYIERAYQDATFNDLVTEQRTRDTSGTTVARSTYRYQPGTRRVAAHGRWLREENRVLTTTMTYDARGLLISTTDPLTHTTRYGYDSAGNQNVITDTLGLVTRRTYDPSGRMTTQTDARGAVTTWTYNPLTGRLDTMRDALGNVTRYEYDSRGRKTKVTDARNASTSYQYNQLDQLVIITDTLGFATRYEYDANGNQNAVLDARNQRSSTQYDSAHGWARTHTDPLGNVTRFDYDGRGRLASLRDSGGAASTTIPDGFGRPAVQIDAFGNRTRFRYDGMGRVISQTNALGFTTLTQYDSLDRTRVITDALNQVTRFAYDDAGRQIAVRDARGAATQMQYDAAGRLLAATNALTQTTRYGYDAVGNQTVVTDTLGYVTRSTYDLLGRRITQVAPNSATTRYGYDALGNQTVMTNTLGYVTRTQYDAANRVIAVTDPLSQITRYGYDAVGNQTVITDTRGFATRYEYDSANRRIAMRDALNTVTRYGYDAVSHPTIITDTAGVTSTTTYDLGGRQIATTDGLGHTMRQGYDVLGRVAFVTDTLGIVTRYDYDAGGRVQTVTENYQNGVAANVQTNVRTQFRYDPNGNLTDTIDARGFTTHTDYDLLNRPIRMSDPLSNTQRLFYTPRGELQRTVDALNRTTVYTYNSVGQLTTIDYPSGTADVSYQYNRAGQVITMTDGLGQTVYGYDQLQRLHTRTRSGRTITYTYAPTSQVSQIDYWTNGSVVYAYDAAERLQTITPWGVGTTNYTWRTPSLPATVTRPNGVTTTYGYDRANRLRSLLHQRGATTLQDIRATLDDYGNRRSVSDLTGSTTVTTTFQYDPLQRLKQAAYPTIPGGPAASTATYQLDPVGNRTSDGATSRSYLAADRVQGWQYDANGNLLNDGTRAYTYDAANRLTTLTQGSVVTTYGYDGAGNLVRETSGGVTTDYVLDEQGPLPRILAAVASGGNAELYAYGPEGLVAQRALIGGSTQPVQYPLLDSQGSLRHLTDTSGTLTLTRRYDAWGVVQQQTGTASSRLGYTGELQSQGLVYLRARWYHPTLGTFTSRDRFAGYPERPASRHPYLYGYANPGVYTDPSGFSGEGPGGPLAPCDQFTPQPGQPAGDCLPSTPAPTDPPTPTPSPAPSPTPFPSPTPTNPPSPTRPPAPTPPIPATPTPPGPQATCAPWTKIKLPPIDIGYILGIGAFGGAGGGYGGGAEIVYDLYDFEADMFYYHGFGGALPFGVSANVYAGVVFGWSFYNNDIGVENYTGPFGSFSAGWGPASGQIFFGAPAPNGWRMFGFSVGAGVNFGTKLTVRGKTTSWPAPFDNLSLGGSGMTWYSIGGKNGKFKFHDGGFHQPTLMDAVKFAAFVAASPHPTSQQMVAIIFYNALAWSTQ